MSVHRTDEAFFLCGRPIEMYRLLLVIRKKQKCFFRHLGDCCFYENPFVGVSDNETYIMYRLFITGILPANLTGKKRYSRRWFVHR